MKWKLLPFIVLIGLLFLIPKSSSYTMENVYVSINSGDFLGLGALDPTSYILISVTSGSLNSTYSVLDAGTDSGSWSFQSNVTGTIQVTDPAKDYDIRASGSFTKDETTGYVTKIFQADEVTTIYWDTVFEPIFPFGFIMGMVGLTSMFGGSLWMIKKIKEHELHDAIIEGFIVTIVGAALFMAWLWM